MHGSSKLKSDNENASPCIRSKFPALNQQGSPVYFDNAATTQIPQNVTESVQNYYQNGSANPGRGDYPWAFRGEDAVQQTRDDLAEFIGADTSDNIVFTSGTTMGLNMTASCWGRYALQQGDEILVCASDHHSMVYPWQALAKEMNLVLKTYGLNPNGSINLEELSQNITQRTKVCCITHVNNVAGWVNDLNTIRKSLPDRVILNVDAAQSISHIPINVESAGIDFLSFSAHKMFAQTGVGVLYVSPRVQNQMTPLLYGGGMAEAVSADPLCKKLEAGTLNMAGVISMNAALQFIKNNTVGAHLADLTQYLYGQLLQNPRIDLLYEQKPYALERLSGIASFTVEGWDSGELGDFLADNGIFVRTGRHCTGAQESSRISLQAYNTKDEIDKTCALLHKLSEQDSSL